MIRVTKIILSLWLVYHLFVILLFPNTQSLLSRKLDFILLPYANTFNLNTPWQFFSPFPGPKMYIEYTTYKHNPGAENQEIIEDGEKHFFPPKNHYEPDWDNWRRQLYLARFVATESERFKKYFIPWLCRKHPGVTGISLEVIFAPVPNVEKASQFMTIEEMEQPQTAFKGKFDCESKHEEQNS